MALPHRDRQPVRKRPVKFAEAGIAIPARIGGDVLFPEDRERHMLALEFAMDDRPVRFGNAPVALLLARILIEQRLQFGVAQLRRKRPA
jgi:hypothetical protein